MKEPTFWHRFVIGDAPFGFALEVLLRTIVVYACLLLAGRLLGKRMSGLVTNLELAVLLMLGAIVSSSMQAAGGGVVNGLALLVGVVVLQVAFGKLGAWSPRVERMLESEASMLVKDGVIIPGELARARISQLQLFSVLRTQQVRSLGELERVYLEGDGSFSVLRREPPVPGLSLVADLQGDDDARQACAYCGQLRGPDDLEPGACGVCGRHVWALTVVT